MNRPEESSIWNEEVRIICQFAFKCPRRWTRLTPTHDTGIRHCSECERDVHLALTEEHFRQAAEEGRCLAVRVLTTKDPVSYFMGNFDVLYRRHLRKS